MKHILTFIIRKLDHPWWELRTSEGDPASEKRGHYVLAGLLSLVRTKLKRMEHDNAKVDP